MKRVVTVVVGAGLVLVIGCGTQNYEYRLEHTIDQMKYQRRLNDNLTEPSTKGTLEELQIYLRPPKTMTGPAQTFQLAALEPGKFDVEASFIEPEKQSLHVLARVEQPKTPAKKGVPKARIAPARRLQHRDRGPGQERLWGRARPETIQGGEERAPLVQGREHLQVLAPGLERKESSDLPVRREEASHPRSR